MMRFLCQELHFSGSMPILDEKSPDLNPSNRGTLQQAAEKVVH
jgi:hypothetical protein